MKSAIPLALVGALLSSTNALTLKSQVQESCQPAPETPLHGALTFPIAHIGFDHVSCDDLNAEAQCQLSQLYPATCPNNQALCTVPGNDNAYSRGFCEVYTRADWWFLLESGNTTPAVLANSFLLTGITTNINAGFITWVERGLGARYGWCDLDPSRSVLKPVDLTVPGNSASCDDGSFIRGFDDVYSPTNAPINDIGGIEGLYCGAPENAADSWCECYDYNFNVPAIQAANNQKETDIKCPIQGTFVTAIHRSLSPTCKAWQCIEAFTCCSVNISSA